jgi:DNA topoisomerase III
VSADAKGSEASSTSTSEKPREAVAIAIAGQYGQTFRAFWEPRDAGVSSSAEHLDGEGRLLKRDVAEAVRERVAGHPGAVTAGKHERKTEPPPLLYSLADLQVDAGRKLGLSAKAVLDACQNLYETHRLLTYPRSDCSHLPEGHHGQAGEVLDAIARNLPSLVALIGGADPALRSKAWNDKKVTAHHAIIPTAKSGSLARELSERERAVYDLVSRRYLAQFFGPHEYLQSRVELEIAGERFVASGRQVDAIVTA